MKFFKKVGRPTDEEQMIIDAIVNLVNEKGLSIDEVPDCNNLDDLLSAVELIENINSENNTEVEQEQHKTDDESDTYFQEIPENELIEVLGEKEDNQQEIESEFENTEDLPNFQDVDYDPFDEPIIERSYTKLEDDKQESKENEEDDKLDLDETITPLDDLNPETKRKAAEKTADAILKGYKQLSPEPFKWWCKFPENKIEQMTFEGEIDTGIEVQPGLSFDDYVKQTNEQIDEIFEVQQETLDEIKEPLVEVLMEQKLELTPQQRLTMAILSHLLQMFTMAMKLWGQNKRILEYQKHLTQLAYKTGKAA